MGERDSESGDGMSRCRNLGGRARRARYTCKASDDCFACPLADCAVDQRYPNVNEILTPEIIDYLWRVPPLIDDEYTADIKSRQQER